MGFDIEDIKNLAQFGQYLKNAREQKNISIEEIHKETKIRTKYLTAIEKGDFSMIPGGDVYVKGFLKNYARCIGLEPTHIIELYKKLRGEPREEESPVEFSEQPSLANSSRQTMLQLDVIWGKVGSFVKENYRKIGAVLLTTCFVLVLAMLIKTFTGKDNSENNVPIDTQAPVLEISPEEEREKPEEEMSIAEEKEEVKVEIVEDTNQNTIYAIYDEYIEVTLAIVDRCWIQVHRDNMLDFEGILTSGDSKTWEAKDNIKIRIGNPPAVNLAVNGKELGRPDGVARDFIFERRTD